MFGKDAQPLRDMSLRTEEKRSGEVAAAKKIAREEAKRRRAKLKSEERDARLAQVFFASRYASVQSVFIYDSFGTEADTHRIIRTLEARGTRVCVPKVMGRRMIAVPYREQESCTEDTPCELVVVPLLAADTSGHRLGYGGGYYDRYFGEHPDAFAVGLMYLGQLVPSLPNDAFDVPLGEAVTEEGIYTFGEVPSLKRTED